MFLPAKSEFLVSFIYFFMACFVEISSSVNIRHENGNNFEINGFYLDDMLSYSPDRFGNYFNSSSDDNFTIFAAEANRPQELQCPSMNVISTRYRCKVHDLSSHLFS